LRGNPIQFATVREDPRLEQFLVERFSAKHALLIASGGCTALSLRASHPACKLTLLDMNPDQLALVQAKLSALELSKVKRDQCLNVGDASPSGLNACGNFESLFRVLRTILCDFVIPRGELIDAFRTPGTIARLGEGWFSDPYWPVAFTLAFHTDFLNTMFGPSATQHAEPDSYPRYFQQVIERGLRRSDAFDNYFLHHILLGHYLDRALPQYMREPVETTPFETVCGVLNDVSDIGAFDLISLSNVMDWMSEAEQKSLSEALAPARAGTALIIRQLNNERDLTPVLGLSWKLDEALGRTLLEMDRSLFYNRILVYVRV
jgi:S-adenosylmethionine-diacylglycerol 3-amino-3-carboxypropyl transferase